jgi:hypothetical protein
MAGGSLVAFSGAIMRQMLFIAILSDSVEVDLCLLSDLIASGLLVDQGLLVTHNATTGHYSRQEALNQLLQKAGFATCLCSVRAAGVSSSELDIVRAIPRWSFLKQKSLVGLRYWQG